MSASGAAIEGGRRTQKILRARRDAPREIRTPTVQTDHKALNLARLPVPPQARSRLSINAGHSPLDVVRGPGYSANTCSDHVNSHGFGGRSDGRHGQPHQAAEGDLRVRQDACARARLSADRS